MTLWGCAPPEDPVTLDPRIAQVTRWTQLMVDAWQVPGAAVGIIEDGELAWRLGFGETLLGSGQPVTAQTRFRVGSISKMFTAAALLPLVDEGLLSLSDPAADALPGVSLATPEALASMTLAQLLSHSSGLQAPGLPNTCAVDPASLGDIIAERAPGWQLWAEQEQFFLYANPGYALAGHAAELAAGVPFSELVADRVLAPAGLEQTTYFREEAEAAGDFAIGHSLDLATGSVVEHQDFSTRYCGASFPSGGLISTLDDLGRFAEILMAGGGGGLSADTLDVMTNSGWAFSETSRYGYGIQVGSYSGHRYWMHTGSLDGFQSLLWLFPDDGIGVIVMVNSDHFIEGVGAPWSKPTHRIAEHVVQTFLEDVEPAWRQPPTIRPEEEWVDRYTGTFVSAQDWGTVQIVFEDGTLWMELPDSGERKAMQPYSKDKFSVPTEGSDGRTHYPVVSFVAEGERTEWLISGGWGIAQRASR